jgi:hypothetical protein
VLKNKEESMPDFPPLGPANPEPRTANRELRTEVNPRRRRIKVVTPTHRLPHLHKETASTITFGNVSQVGTTSRILLTQFENSA